MGFATKKKRNKALSAQWMAQRDQTLRAKPPQEAVVNEKKKRNLRNQKTDVGGGKKQTFAPNPLPVTPLKPVRGHARETKLVGKKLRKGFKFCVVLFVFTTHPWLQPVLKEMQSV